MEHKKCVYDWSEFGVCVYARMKEKFIALLRRLHLYFFFLPSIARRVREYKRYINSKEYSQKKQKPRQRIRRSARGSAPKMWKHFRILLSSCVVANFAQKIFPHYDFPLLRLSQMKLYGNQWTSSEEIEKVFLSLWMVPSLMMKIYKPKWCDNKAIFDSHARTSVRSHTCIQVEAHQNATSQTHAHTATKIVYSGGTIKLDAVQQIAGRLDLRP